MKGKGQITLEIVILLLVVINIYAFISTPLAEVGRAASTSVGTAALATKAVNTIAQKANLVGISGDGARDYALIDIRKDFDEINCASDSIQMVFTVHDVTDVDDPESFGLSSLLRTSSESYSKSIDFNIDCEDFSPLLDANRRVCVTFENTGDEVEIKVDDHCRWAEPDCNNGVREGSEECDTDGSVCASGECLPNCKCKPVSPPSQSYCGDGIAQRPNDDGFDEECDGPDDAACPGECIPQGEAGACTCKEFCGDNIKQDPNYYGFSEECDGSDDNDCPGRCRDDCTCSSGPPPPICTCDTCDTCNDALNNPGCPTVTLTGDLSSPTDCIQIAPGKTFDCQGYSITGTGAPNSYGIRMDIAVNNAEVGNCVLSGWDVGIRLYEAHYNTLAHITANNNRIGLGVYNSGNNNVDNNTFCNNVEYDIFELPIGAHPNMESENNTCDTTGGTWSDKGETGCTYTC